MNRALTAHLVDGRRLGRVGHTGTEHDLTSGGLTGATLEDLTKVEVLDLSGLNAGLGEDALDGGNAELDGGSLLESTLEGSDGRAGLYDRERDGIERREDGVGSASCRESQRGGLEEHEGRGTYSADDEDLSETAGRGRRCLHGCVRGGGRGEKREDKRIVRHDATKIGQKPQRRDVQREHDEKVGRDGGRPSLSVAAPYQGRKGRAHHSDVSESGSGDQSRRARRRRGES